MVMDVSIFYFCFYYLFSNPYRVVLQTLIIPARHWLLGAKAFVGHYKIRHHHHMTSTPGHGG